MTTTTPAPDLARIETGALLLRLGLGTMFIAHALLKYFASRCRALPSSSAPSACPRRSAT